MLYGMDESSFDNTLVAQKNAIIELCDAGNTIGARAALAVVSPLWKQCRYEYKTREIAIRIEEQERRIELAKPGAYRD